MKNIFIFVVTNIFFLLNSATLQSDDFRNSNNEYDYILTIDGGGSHTRVIVLDKKGQNIPIKYLGETSTSILLGPSNIQEIGLPGMNKLLTTILENVFIDNSQISLNAVIPRTYILACFAGIGRKKEKNLVTSIFLDHGFSQNKMHLTTDSGLCSSIAGDGGIILISGTGSICMALENGVQHRAGGLGRLIDDKGSGYHIGIQAIRSTLEEMYGYGEKTLLTPMIKKRFQLAQIQTAISLIHSHQKSPADISAITEDVFNGAFDFQDKVCMEIVQKAATELAKLATINHNRLKNPTNEIWLWGGLFANSQSDRFISMIKDKIPKELEIKNISKKNPTLIYAKKFLVNP